MKILVTGSAGFLGSWVVDDLLKRGHTVVSVDNFSGGFKENLPIHPNHTFYHVDLLNLERLTDVGEGCELIYHCAAAAYEGLSVFSPSSVVQNIVVGSVNVGVVAARCGVKRVVNCSSMARYGKIATPYLESDTPGPVDPYGVAKLCAEHELNILGDCHGFSVVHAIPHNIYGPRQRYDDPYRNVASIMINRILQGKPPIIYGDGNQLRCFSYISDVLDILTRLGFDDIPHTECFNVGPDDVYITINVLATTLLHILDSYLEPIHYPDRPREVKEAICSSDKIRRWFNFSPKVSLNEGLKKLVRYIVVNGVKEFDYTRSLEIVNESTPKTWKDRLI